MADNATIGVDLGGMVTTTGAINAAALQSLADFLVSEHLTFVQASKTSFPLPAGEFGMLTSDPVITLDANSPGLNTEGFNATISGGGPNTVIIGQGGVDSIVGAAGHIFLEDGSGVIDSTATAASISALFGAYTITGGSGDALDLAGGVSSTVTAFSGGLSNAILGGGVIYVSGAADTVSATAGADTVYGDGTTYFAGGGNNVFAGYVASPSIASASTASTVFAGLSGSTTIQAGSHGDLTFLQGAQDRFVSGGGDDTIWGSSAGAVAPTIFGTTGSYELMVSGMSGGLALGFGNNTTLDGANTTGGLTYFANPGMGNQTFIGSASGNDSFYIGSQDVGTSLVEIRGWHSGDTVNLTAFGAADQANAASVIKSGGSLFKLSDGTTVSFVGGHPTGGNGSFLT